MDRLDFLELSQRIGKEHLGKRLAEQAERAAKFYAKSGYSSFHPENSELLYVILEFSLKMLGLYGRGINNALDYRVERVKVPLTGLPPQFNGFRILQISDLHADAIPDNGRKLTAILEGLEADLCVITGDFRFLTHDAYEPALKETEKIVRTIDVPYARWGILGNHDFIEFVPALERMGLKILFNEAVPIRKEGAEIWLAGIDDAHLYDCADIPKALTDVPENGLTVMLSHTPETYAEAARAGVDYLLCGHTHGGQICLPKGIPIMTNASCPRRFCSGFWRFKNMSGYTSRGTGSSGHPVRFFCPPEITLHELVTKT